MQTVFGGRRAAEWPQNLVIWLLATLIAVFFATLLKESAILDGHYLPRTNDSLYHARRILDTIGPRGFYEFDDRLHVPDGTWIPWPWAYDYLIAQALRVALWIAPALDPMAFISHVAVFWLGINAALFLACLHAVGLGTGTRAVAMLGFALSPLIQLAHATAMIDHHFMELTFALLSIWLGVRWLQPDRSTRDAALLGIALGIAPAFHNGLFILQLPLLGAVLLLWIKRFSIPMHSMKVFCGSLLAATLAAVIPSAPFRAGFFEFALLSWFHLYIAVCTSATLMFMALRSCSLRNFGMLAALAALLGAPILAQALRGAMFFSGDLAMLGLILEVQSPFRMFFETVGPTETASYYSWLLLAAPVLLVYHGWRALRDTESRQVFYSVWAVFGLGMMLLQYRFNYFGLLFLISSPLLLLEQAARRYALKPSITLVAALGALLVLYQPALRDRLFTIYAPGGDRDYAGGLPVFDFLAEQCADEPKLVLANSDDGNAILYHTNCKVLVNNFIMRPDDEEKLAVVDRLLRGTPEDIRSFEPPIDYFFVRARDFTRNVGNADAIDDRSLIARSFLLSEQAPPGFERVKNVVYRTGEPPEPRLYGRVFRVLHDAP